MFVMEYIHVINLKTRRKEFILQSELSHNMTFVEKRKKTVNANHGCSTFCRTRAAAVEVIRL